jgi:hypothetical protein
MVLGSVLWVSQYAVWMRLTYFNRALKFVEENFDIMHSLERTIHPAIPNKVSDWVEKDTKLNPPGWPFNFDKLVDTVDSRAASRKNSMYSRTSSVYSRNNSIYSRNNPIFGSIGGFPRSIPCRWLCPERIPARVKMADSDDFDPNDSTLDGAMIASVKA